MGQLSFTNFVDSAGSEHLELLSNDRIAGLVGMKPERVSISTGSDSRYILKRGATPQQLAEEVVDKFLESTRLSYQDIGGLALVHTHYETTGSRTQDIANAIAKKSDLTKDRIVALSYGCAGFPEIVSRAAALCENLSENKHVLVVTVETPDIMLDPTNRSTGALFAADATATSLWKGDGHTLLFADTRDVPPPNGYKGPGIFTFEESDVPDFHKDTPHRTIFSMDGNEAYVNAQLLMNEGLFTSLDRVMADPQYHGRRVRGVPHQANWKIMRSLDDDARLYASSANEYQITDFRVINAADGRNNTIASTIPSALARWLLGAVVGKTTREGVTEEYDLPEKGDIVLIPAAGVCMTDPVNKMSQGFGAMEW